MAYDESEDNKKVNSVLKGKLNSTIVVRVVFFLLFMRPLDQVKSPSQRRVISLISAEMNLLRPTFKPSCLPVFPLASPYRVRIIIHRALFIANSTASIRLLQWGSHQVSRCAGAILYHGTNPRHISFFPL